MATQKTKFAVGLFVTIGLTLAILVFIWLGMSRFLQKGRFFVTYFDESVQGLDVDSPVKYRGVFIGRVDNIGVAPDSKLIKVVLKIESGQELGQNIVAQMKSVGITGRMFVELDQKKEGEPDRSPRLSFPSKYPIIASKPSEISGLIGGFDQILEQIKALNLEQISDKIKATLDNINQTVEDANVERISRTINSSFEKMEQILEDERWDKVLASAENAGQSLNSLLDQADLTLARVQGIVVRKEETIKTGLDNFSRAMEKANILMNKSTALVSGADASLSELMQYLVVAAQNLELASQNLNQLMELLAEHPSQLLFGEPPRPRDADSVNQ
ncbi:MAG: MCE family protein [Deltaproteobacteria bacterium]|jgi:phospholipid/cholesterol/gamma-HCH transport system substrate-binding protein|nr:MCE family protein [Deltaproteobacteria bacterium]